MNFLVWLGVFYFIDVFVIYYNLCLDDSQQMFEIGVVIFVYVLVMGKVLFVYDFGFQQSVFV